MRIRIEGKTPLSGKIHPSGNSNSAQALVAAALLGDQPITLRNYPDTISARRMVTHAQELGATAEWSDKSTVTITANQLTRRTLDQNETDSSVGTLLFVAPLVCRRGYARLELDYPLNRIRTHLDALRDLGIDVLVSSGAVDLKSSTWEQKDILLTQTSVTATAIVMMLAAYLGNETTIRNAASEPHIEDLGGLLNDMGARVEGLGSNVLIVHGAELHNSASYTVSYDHIEAASIAAVCAVTGGRAQIEGVQPKHMRLISRIFWRLGINFDLDDGTLYVSKHENLIVSNREEDVDASIETAPWPGFPSDLVAVATVVATQARGTSLIHEKLFSNRLLFVDKLKSMGAQIVLCDPHRAIVVGPTPLRGTYMDTPDIRAGMGMLAAALIADRTTVIDNAQVLDYSFSNILEKLTSLNAKITIEHD
ncbi:MAG: UDP-N-acetylglucosamine 1-carboxyvinyltransferase [Anaerolineae bacterium]|nr:UDP-N-acetylglucosamine 1-carboxyvinyltransferase [Anaerolineae bacterium]